MIGSQSTANQCQSNGLRILVPYDVGRSIAMCRVTAIAEIAASIANVALPTAAERGPAASAPCAVIGAPFGPARACRARPARGDHAEADDPERTVRRAAMPREVRHAAARRRDDVDVRGVRREDQRRGRAAARAPERRAAERHGEQRVGEVVHCVRPGGRWLVG